MRTMANGVSGTTAKTVSKAWPPEQIHKKTCPLRGEDRSNRSPTFLDSILPLATRGTPATVGRNGGDDHRCHFQTSHTVTRRSFSLEIGLMPIVKISHWLNFNFRLNLDIDLGARFVGFNCRGRKGRLWRALTRQAWCRGLCAYRATHCCTVASCTVAGCTVAGQAIASRTGAHTTRITAWGTHRGLARGDRSVPGLTYHAV